MAHSASTTPTGPQEPSIGSLVQSAMADVSTLIRSEIELAKAEVTGSAKKAAIGGGALAAAGVVLAFSSFFLFFAVAELLARYLMPRWVAFLVVFVLLVLLAAVVGFIGSRFLKRIQKPERTIETLKDLPEIARRDTPGRRERELPVVTGGQVVKADPHARLR